MYAEKRAIYIGLGKEREGSEMCEGLWMEVNRNPSYSASLPRPGMHMVGAVKAQLVDDMVG